MAKEIFKGLLYNTSLLLMLSILYSSFTLRVKGENKKICLLSGVIIGLTGLGIMTYPIPLMNGVFFDTRSILISSTGLFFGFGPTIISSTIIAAYRLYLGGVGAPTGVLVIFTSAAIGLMWRKFKFKKYIHCDIKEAALGCYIMGIVVHLVMLLEMLTLGSISDYVMESILLPIITIYPFGSLVIGIILKDQLDNKSIIDKIEYSEKKYKSLVNCMKQGLVLSEVLRNEDGKILGIKCLDGNDNFFKIVNEDSRRLVGNEVTEFFKRDEKEVLIDFAEKVLEDGSYSKEIYHERCGKYFIMDAYKVENNQFAILINDITKKKELENSIREKDARYRRLFNNNNAAMLLIDTDTGIIVDANPSAGRFYRYSIDELQKMKISDINIMSEDEVMKEMNLAMLEKREYFNFVHRIGNGEKKEVDVYSGPVEIDGKKLLYSIVHDVTEKNRKQKEIEYLSFHDQLTGLYNRRFFEEEMLRLDNKRNLPLSIIMADVNGLKLVNDAFGHGAGDRLLVMAGLIMKDVCRDDEIISRVGGDEFVILLPETDKNQSYSIIERIRDRASLVKDESYNISISFGVSTKTSEDMDIEGVYKESEDDMYRNKLFESRRQKGNMIETILNTLYEREPREKEHSERVSRLCGSMGRELGLKQDEINELETTGLLHDIGKVALDTFILERKSRLSDDEREQLRRHPDIGYNILSSVNSLSKTADYVLAHHERWDGSGYPRGLKGEEIPYITRIISLADAYDRMTRQNKHRISLTVEEAMDEIRRCSGIQFDPELVEIFIEKVLVEEIVKKKTKEMC